MSVPEHDNPGAMPTHEVNAMVKLLRARVAELEAKLRDERDDWEKVHAAFVQAEAECDLLRAEREVMRAALLAVVTKLDYLRGLWGDEAITRRLADHCREAAGLGADAPAHGPWGSVGASDFAREADAREAVEAANWRGLESGAPAAPGEGEVTP